VERCTHSLSFKCRSQVTGVRLYLIGVFVRVPTQLGPPAHLLPLFCGSGTVAPQLGQAVLERLDHGALVGEAVTEVCDISTDLGQGGYV